MEGEVVSLCAFPNRLPAFRQAARHEANQAVRGLLGPVLGKKELYPLKVSAGRIYKSRFWQQLKESSTAQCNGNKVSSSLAPAVRHAGPIGEEEGMWSLFMRSFAKIRRRNINCYLQQQSIPLALSSSDPKARFAWKVHLAGLGGQGLGGYQASGTGEWVEGQWVVGRARAASPRLWEG